MEQNKDLYKVVQRTPSITPSNTVTPTVTPTKVGCYRKPYK